MTRVAQVPVRFRGSPVKTHFDDRHLTEREAIERAVGQLILSRRDHIRWLTKTT